MYEFPNDFVAHRTLDPAGALEYIRASAKKPREQGAGDEQQPDTLRVAVFPAGPIEVRLYLDAAGPRKIQLHRGWMESEISAALKQAAELMLTLKAVYRATAK